MGRAALGVAEHLGWAWFVAVAFEEGAPVLLTSRRMELVAADLPCMPFHHDTDGMELEAADALLARVKTSASEHALAALESLRSELDPRHRIALVALRHPPLSVLPDSVEDSRRSSHVNNRADGMLYHQAICGAASQFGIQVAFHKRGEEESLAARALGLDGTRLQAMIADLGRTARNWTREHRSAAAAALAALCAEGPGKE